MVIGEFYEKNYQHIYYFFLSFTLHAAQSREFPKKKRTIMAINNTKLNISPYVLSSITNKELDISSEKDLASDESAKIETNFPAIDGVVIIISEDKLQFQVLAVGSPCDMVTNTDAKAQFEILEKFGIPNSSNIIIKIEEAGKEGCFTLTITGDNNSIEFTNLKNILPLIE